MQRVEVGKLVRIDAKQPQRLRVSDPTKLPGRKRPDHA